MDSSDLFSSSPVKYPPVDYSSARDERPKTPATPTDKVPQTAFDAEEARDAALQRELDGVRQINQVIEGVIGTLEQSRTNMKTVSQTVGNASTLLDTWTRLLSQTEHNQRLLLDPQWKGATQDLQDLEAETLQRQQEAERREAEAQRRRDEAKRKAEEDEQRRLVSASSSTTRGATASGRGLRSGLRGNRVGRTAYRGTSTYGTRSASSRGGVAPGANSSSIGRGGSASTRSGSNIGRGIGTTRGTGASGRGVR